MSKLAAGTGEIEEIEIEGITKYTCGDIAIYKIALESLVKHYTNSYLILDREASLVDLGFDSYKARSDLEKGFEIINKEFKESINLGEVSNIVITHTHQDHFGLLSYDKLKGKRLYVHELDSEWIKDLEGCNRRWGEHLAKLGREAGWDMSLQIPPSPKGSRIEPGDYELIEIKDGDRIINGYNVYHIPGHTPGQICLKVGDVIFLGDQILSSIMPHQSSKSAGGAGLQAYLNSLGKVAGLGAEIGLPGHEDAIYPIKAKAEEMEDIYARSLENILDLCSGGKGLGQLTREYYERYPEMVRAAYGYNTSEDTRWLLALEVMMAHLEYLIENNRMERMATGTREIQYRSASQLPP